MYLVCGEALFDFFSENDVNAQASKVNYKAIAGGCLLYTSPSPRDGLLSRMPSSA